MPNVAMISVSDFGLTTRGGTYTLNDNEKKLLLHTEDKIEFNAFYHTAKWEAGIPRLFTMNSGLKPDGRTIDYGFWFRNHGVHGIDILADALLGPAQLKEAEARLNQSSDEVRAFVRRPIIFGVTRHLKKEGTEAEAGADAVLEWQQARLNMSNIPRPSSSL